eukprot:jgi/Picre1/33745/NNA_001224.t1
MLRRNARLRKEYLYRKSLEGKEKELYEKKRKIRQALEEGKPIPTELRREEAELRREVELEDDNTAVPRTHMDDEYANAGALQPKVLITTSRDPSSRLAQFAKELKLIFPNSQRLNRGGLVVGDLIESSRSHEFTDIIVVHEHRGEPDGTVSEAYPHLIFEGFTSKLGKRVSDILKHLFPAPKMETKRVMTFANMDDYVSFRHHTYEMPRGEDSITLTEKGPRFDMKLYQIKLGTLDQKHAENEYVLRSYINSAKRQKLQDDDDDGNAS